MSSHCLKLEKAAKVGDAEEVKRLIGVEKCYNYSIIISAAENGHLDLLKYLIGLKGWSFLGYRFSAPLTRAIENGHLEIVKYFLESNWDERFNSFEVINESLKCAIGKKQNEITFYILDREITKYRDGKDKSLKDKTLENINDSLYEASRKGNVETVKYLVENGFSIRGNNDIALRVAVRGGHLEVVKYLMEKGADVKNVEEFDLKVGRRIAGEERYIGMKNTLV